MSVSPSDVLNRVQPLVDWQRQWQSFWSHLHVGGVALRIQGEWIGVDIAAVLSDSAEPPRPHGVPVVRTDDVFPFRASIPQERLVNLLDVVASGVIPAGFVPGLDEPIRVRRIANYMACYTNERQATGRLPRLMETEIESDKLSAYFVSTSDASDWLVRVRRTFRAHGYGSLESLAASLTLRERPAELRFDSSGSVRILAPLPVRLVKARQDPWSGDVRAAVMVGNLVPPGQVRLHVEHARRGDFWQEPVSPKRGGTIRVRVAQRVPRGAAKVLMCLAGYGVVDERELQVLPRWRRSPRVVALSEADPELARLRADLAATPGTKNYEKYYERGISLLLDLMGFSSMWWGPHLKSSFDVPTDGADVIVTSRSARQIYLVECTTDQVSDKKVRLLVDRTIRMRKSIHAKLGGRPRIVIRAVLAIGVARDSIPLSVRAVAKQDDVALLTRDDGLEFLEMLGRGESERRVRDRFRKLFPLRRTPASEAADVF